MTAILINFLGHRVPGDVFDKLRAQGYRDFRVYTCYDSYLDREQDLGDQVRARVLDLLEREVKGEKLKECEGERFFLAPGYSPGAVLIYTAVATAMPPPPHFLVTGKALKSNQVELKQSIDLSGWANWWRDKGRKAVLQH